MSERKLERAREHCFMAGVGDASMALCEANVPFGLAKIHHAQEQLGVDPDATFVGSPDATVTRNENRWSQGFGYGGVYAWSGDFTVLDIKPNACGMIVGTLPDLPALEELRGRLHALDSDGLMMDGVAIESDLTESNHFVDVFEVARGSSGAGGSGADKRDGNRANDAVAERLLGGARYVYIMHSSGHEHRGPTAKGPGLYWDQSEELRSLARKFDTPWGSLHILQGERAASWYEFYREVQDFNHRRREALADFLFGDHQTLINATHQGLVRGYDRANIGCYTFEDRALEESADEGPAGGDAGGAGLVGHDSPVFPLTLSPTLPAFLVRGKRNIGDAAIDRLGWRERIERHGLMNRVAGTNLLPHGGGYAYPHLRGVARVVERGPDDRRFELAPVDPDAALEVIETPRQLEYAYRGMEVKERLEELELGDVVAQLDLRYVLTA